ncbi:MAG: hypothetical protein SXQ77_02600 [Halobacteria archaeon]|nr:hypothetical protein [Halobacteria archaeon]
MEHEQQTKYDVRTVDEIQNRIAEIIGYCRVDGRLHNPKEFNKKRMRSKWVCPDCGAVAGEVDYKRSSELQWVLTEHGGQGQGHDRDTRETESGEETTGAQESGAEAGAHEEIEGGDGDRDEDEDKEALEQIKEGSDDEPPETETEATQ